MPAETGKAIPAGTPAAAGFTATDIPVRPAKAAPQGWWGHTRHAVSTTHGVWAANLDGTYTFTFAGFAFDNGGNFLATQRIRVAVEVNETQDGFSGPFNTDFIGADGQVLASSNGTVRGTRILAESPA